MSDQYKWIRFGTLGCVPDPKSIDQNHRCSILNVFTEYLPAGADKIGWKTTDSDGNSIAGVSFDIEEDKSGFDKKIWSNLTNGSTQSIQEKPDLYIANPNNATQNFNVDWYALMPADSAFPLASWMGDASETLKDVPLNDVAMAGTHDSGTFGICRNSPKGGDASDLLPDRCVEDAARAQGWSWEQQLLAGVRYFDLRLTNFDGIDGQLAGYYFTHSWIGETFDAMLRDVYDFLNAYPKEIIIMDFQHLYEFSANDYSYVFNALNKTFGKKLASYQSFGPTSTVGELMAAGCQVVPILQDNDKDASNPPAGFFKEYPWLWPRHSSLRSKWGDKHTVKGLLEFLNEEINNKPADKLWVLQCQVTLPFAELLNLQKEAQKNVNPAIAKWLNTTVADKPVNIVIVDWIQYDGIPDICVKRN